MKPLLTSIGLSCYIATFALAQDAAQSHDHMQGMQMNAPAMAPMPASSFAAPPDLLKDAAQRPLLRLEDFQHFALTANPTLRQAHALETQAHALGRQAALYPNPSVGYQGEQIRGGSYGGGEQGGFVQQTFLLGGKRALRRDVYEQQGRSYEAGATERRAQVLSDVGQMFYSALAAQESAAIRKRLLGLATDALETAHQLANVGQADAPDVLQAEVEAAQAGVDYTTAQRTYIQMFRSLTTIAGKPDTPLAPLEGDLMHPPVLDTEGLVDRIIKDSPSVKKAQQQIVQAEAELRSAKRESVPDLQIRGGLQQNNELLNQPGRTAVGLQGFATAGIDLPIFNHNQGNIAAAQAAAERARDEVTRVQLSLRARAEPLVESYLASRNEADRYQNEMLPRAQRAYQLYLAKYQQMGAAYPQVLVSQRTYFQLQVALVTALEGAWADAIALENYTLSSGLSPMETAGAFSVINPPGASAASAP